MIIVLFGSVPSQKNDKVIAINKRTGKRFPMTSGNVRAWQDNAEEQLGGFTESFTGRVQIDYMFYVKDNRNRDIDNMVCTVNDALVKSGIIKSDSWQYLKIGFADAEVDKDDPRVELNLTSIS